MKLPLNLKFTGAGLLMAGVLGLLFACSEPASLIKIDGSSTVFPITEAVSEEFQTVTKGKFRVTVGISGTGGGFKKFCRGELAITSASRPILSEEIAACAKTGVEYIELPVAYDALTVVINPANDWADTLTVDDLKKIWEPAAQGKIKQWNQVRPDWPALPMHLYGAGADSGTFDYFTEAMMGKSKASRGDYTASEDDNVLVQGVSRDKNALGYFGFAYYEANQAKLKAVKIGSGAQAVAPSKASVEDGSYQPLSRPIFIYVSLTALMKPEVRQFAEFYLKNAPRLVAQVNYIALPTAAYHAALERLRQGKIGTVFSGKSAVGVKIEELLKKETAS